MDLQRVKNLVRENSVFEVVDSDDGTIIAHTEDSLNVEFAVSGFFEEGGSPSEPANRTEQVSLERQAGKITGRTEEEVASNYLWAFYSRILTSQQAGATVVAEKSIVDFEGLEKLFDSLPNKFSGETCLLTTHRDFQKVLGVSFSSSSLGIRFKDGNKMHNRDLLGWCEPLLLIQGPPSGKIITAEKIAVVLNVPQFLTPSWDNSFGTELQYKVIYPNRVLVHSVR